MPSSMIFVGLVVMWLLILVPAVARRRQEVARPSTTALGGRVLSRPPRRDPETDREPAADREVEMDVRHETQLTRTVSERSGAEEHPRLPAPRLESDPPGRDTRDGRDEAPSEHAGPDRSSSSDRAPDPDPDRDETSGRPVRYRPGRGGFDPEAAAMAARARYAFRQRVVLVLLILAAGSGAAAALTVPQVWWVHGGIDLLLVGYLVHLRRQVRIEEAIRRRRSARMTASRRSHDRPDGSHRSDESHRSDPAPDKAPQPFSWVAASAAVAQRTSRDGSGGTAATSAQQTATAAADPETSAVTGDKSASAGPGSGRSGTATASPTTTAPPAPAAPVDDRPALPRLQPMPPPPLPIGTTVVESEDSDPALEGLDSLTRPDYRRASGQ